MTGPARGETDFTAQMFRPKAGNVRLNYLLTFLQFGIGIKIVPKGRNNSVSMSRTSHGKDSTYRSIRHDSSNLLRQRVLK